MTVRVKIKLESVTDFSWGGKSLRFQTNYDIPEDMRFQKATPSGHIEMIVDNPLALSQFNLGMSYYVDFSPVEPSQD